MSSNLSTYRVPRLGPRVNYSTQLILPNTSYTIVSSDTSSSDTSPNQCDGPESQPLCVKSILMDLISPPRERHTTLNHALDFHAAMHPICPGAPHHHHDAIGGPAVHCASDQLTICKLQCCASQLHPSPFIVPSTLAVPQRLLCFAALPFTVSCGGDPVTVLFPDVGTAPRINEEGSRRVETMT